MVLNADVAEICGIHAGDGYLRNDGHRIELDISGHVEEQGYYDNHVVPLFSKTFHLPVKARFFPHRNTYGFVIRDVDTVELMHEFGFPYGAKSLTVKVPEFIMKNRALWPYFLKGYFDTDGCLFFCKRSSSSYSLFKRTRHYYPIIIFDTVSKDLASQLKVVFPYFDLPFRPYLYKPKKKTENLRYVFHLSGIENLYRWLSVVGMSNPLQYSKFLIWEKYGFCPPKTTYQQRLKILKGELNPNSCYKGPVA